MKIKATQEIEVEISEQQANAICLETLYKKFHWGPNFHIKDDKVYETVSFYTTHDWTEEIFRREASKTDKAICRLLQNWH